MTKGIREHVNEKFASLLPQRAEIGNTAFRKAVMQDAMTVFGISLASAATHYNHTLKTVREADPTLVEGLGRPEDKKGGRKPIHTVQVIKVKTGEPVGDRMSVAKAQALVLASQEKGKVKLAIKDETPAEAPAAIEGAPDATTEAAPQAAEAVAQAAEAVPA